MYSLGKSSGVRCTDAGLFYGPVRLVAKNAATGVYEPGDEAVLHHRLRADSIPAAGGLQAVARALTKGDIAVAQIAALHLRLEPFDRAMLTRMSKANFDPDQPRDDDGKWTDEGSDAPSDRDTSAPNRGTVSILTTAEDQEDKEQAIANDPNLVLASAKEDPTQLMKENFVDAYLMDAQKGADELGVPVENILGLSALESGWGKGRFASKGHNFFNMYSTASPATGSIKARKSNKRVATFKNYADSLQGFIQDSGYLVRGVKDPETFAKALQNAGKFGIDTDTGLPLHDFVPETVKTIKGLRVLIERRKI